MSKKRDESGKGEVPDDFSEAARREMNTEERLREALASGPVEVSEDDSFGRRFSQKAVDDTGDEAWGGGIIARMYGSDDPSEEVPASTDEPSPLSVDSMPEPLPAAPDLHAIGSVDSDNPIQFISNPLDLLGGGGSSPPAESPEEASAPVEPPPEPKGGLDFLADLESSREESVPFVDQEPAGTPLDGNARLDPPVEAVGAPTEEVPAPILEDIAQPSIVPGMVRSVGYSAQPLEGSIGVQPPSTSEVEEIGNSGEFEARILAKKLQARADARAMQDDDDDDQPGLPLIPIMVLSALLVGVAGMGYLIFNLSVGPDAEAVVEQAISGDAKPPVDLPVVSFPDVMGDEPRRIPNGATAEDPMQGELPPLAVRRDERGEVDLYRDPEPEPEPEVAEPAPVAAPTGVATLTARIQVTANQRAMITLDGTPQAPAPIELRVTPGKHTVSAMIPGRADTIQTKEVTAKKDKAVQVGFVF